MGCLVLSLEFLHVCIPAEETDIGYYIEIKEGYYNRLDISSGLAGLLVSMFYKKVEFL